MIVYRNYYKYISAVLTATVCLFLVVTAVDTKKTYAQSVTQESRKESINLSADPAYPNEGQRVELSVSSFLVPLGGASIQWRANGEVIDSGDGVTNTSFQIPNDGDTVNITLVINPSDGPVIKKKDTLRPVTIDLIWEANTTVPPFYQGKKLYAGAGDVSVTALPFINDTNGNRYDKDDLVYEWEYNSLTHGDESGLAKNTFPVDLNSNNNTVSVTVSDRSGNVLGKQSVDIPANSPKLKLYKNDTESGVSLSNAIHQNVNASGDSVIITAYPYYYPLKKEGSSLNYDWSLNGQRVQPPRASNQLTVSAIDSIENYNITTEIESDQFIFPSRSKSISINF